MPSDDSSQAYLKLFEGADPGPRGGLTVSFERFMGFLLGSRLF